MCEEGKERAVEFNGRRGGFVTRPENAPMSSENLLFQKVVENYPAADPWTGSYAHGLFDAFLLITGEDQEAALEQLYEAVTEDRQRSHDEMIDSESEF